MLSAVIAVIPPGVTFWPLHDDGTRVGTASSLTPDGDAAPVPRPLLNTGMVASRREPWPATPKANDNAPLAVGIADEALHPLGSACLS